MPEINVDVDVDVDVVDFLDECSTSEIEEVMEWLDENDYSIQRSLNIEKDIDEDLIKLINCISITTEDEELIKEIASRYA
jgi:hypothetical protein